MDEEQKNRLEQELKFLKESLEADVISKDEYKRGKERIERKITELEQETPAESSEDSSSIEEIKEELPSEQEEIPGVEEKTPETEEQPETKDEYIAKEDIEIKEIKPLPTKIIGAEETLEIKEKSNESEGLGEKSQSKKKSKKGEEDETFSEFDEETQSSKKWLYGIAILLIAAILFFSIRGCTSEELIEEVAPDCLSDTDCKQEGAIGTCLNPDTKESECQFKQDASTNLMVINDKNCELCDSSRIKNTLKTIFPNVKIQNIDYETEEAKQLVNQFDIDALPAYIFDSDVSEAINFDDFKRALVKKGDNYVITNTASGANYYFKREEIENKLDSFLTADIKEKADSNLNEFLGLFEGTIDFEKHLVSEKDKAKLKDELGITSYPAFLINNQIKFGGLQSSDSIREKFCILNKISGCEKELRKNII